MNFWPGPCGGGRERPRAALAATYPDLVDPVLAATLGGAVGLVIGAVAVAATRWSERSAGEPASVDPPLPRLAKHELGRLLLCGRGHRAEADQQEKKHRCLVDDPHRSCAPEWPEN